MRVRLFAVAGLVLALMVPTAIGPAAAQSQEDPNVVPRPDALVRRASDESYRGNGIYNTTGDRQARSAEVRPRGRVSYYVTLQNDSDTADDLRVRGTPESTGFAVRYFLDGASVSPAVKAGTLVLHDVPAGGSRTLRVEMEATRRAQLGSERRVLVRTFSVTDGTASDAVRITTRLPVFTPEQRRIADLVNQSRSANNRGRLTLNRTLTQKAQAWAQHLSQINALVHSNLASGAPPGWRALGENIGYGLTIVGVHQAFMGSSGHRSNILGNWNAIGTGYYAQSSSRIFIVQVFMRS